MDAYQRYTLPREREANRAEAARLTAAELDALTDTLWRGHESALLTGANLMGFATQRAADDFCYELGCVSIDAMNASNGHEVSYLAP